VNVPANLKSANLPVAAEIIAIEVLGGVANLLSMERGHSPREWQHPKERWRVPIGPPYRLYLYQHSFARNFRLVANPQFWGKGLGGRGWYR